MFDPHGRRPCYLNREIAAFIRSKGPWRTFCHLTFKEEVKLWKAEEIMKAFLRGVAREIVGEHVDYVVVTDVDRGHVRHFHLLLAFDGQPEYFRNRAYVLWQRSHVLTGFCRFQNYRPGGGAELYMAKHDFWDVNTACPRKNACRRVRCIKAPGRW